MKGYRQFVYLASNEWECQDGVSMQAIAEKILFSEENKDRFLLLIVNEHAGWFLEFVKLEDKPIVVGTANDTAIFSQQQQNARVIVRSIEEWEDLPEIRREDRERNKKWIV